MSDDRDQGELAVISALLAGVAHDLNNLLMVIGSCAHFLRQTPDLAEAALADAALLDEAVQRAAALTERLSAFGRRGAVRVTPLDLGAVIAEMDKMLRRLVGEDVVVQVAAARGLIVRADGGRIEQLVLAAALSARRLLPRGGTMSVEVAGNTDAAQLVIAVSPRAPTEASGPFPALALIDEIAREAAGSLAVESLPGGGLRLCISLPLQAGAPARTERQAPGKGETVLLVEDDEGTRRLLGRVLAGAGYRVLSATDVADALRIAEGETQPIALLLTDVVLPDGSGMDVVTGLSSRRPGVRVILSSGYPDSVLASYGVPTAGMPRLAKPFTSVELLVAVREAIDAPEHAD